MKNDLAAMVLLCLMIVLAGCASCNAKGGPIRHTDLKDGIYEGTATEGPVKVITEVTIANHRITDLNLIKHRTWKGKPAQEIIPERIIKAQSTDVDGVLGATMSRIGAVGHPSVRFRYGPGGVRSCATPSAVNFFLRVAHIT